MQLCLILHFRPLCWLQIKIACAFTEPASMSKRERGIHSDIKPSIVRSPPGLAAPSRSSLLLRFKHDFDASIFLLAENFVSVRRIRQRQSMRDNIIEADLFLM